MKPSQIVKTKQIKISRHRGSPPVFGSLPFALLIGFATFFAGLWLPLISEKLAWNSWAENFVGVQLKTIPQPTLPLLKVVSRMSLGEKLHTNRNLLQQKLPIIFTAVENTEYVKAEKILLDMFQDGILQEPLESDDTLIVWYQGILNESESLRQKMRLTDEKIKTRTSALEVTISYLESENNKVRSFLGLPNTDSAKGTKKPNSNQQDIKSWSTFYQNGPLNGFPVQPELPIPPSTMAELAKIIVTSLSSDERLALTDEKLFSTHKQIQTRLFSLRKSYNQLTAELSQLQKDVKIYFSESEKKRYILKKSLQKFYETYCTPPAIVGESLFLR
jgi:hypothetical protein